MCANQTESIYNDGKYKLQLTCVECRPIIMNHIASSYLILQVRVCCTDRAETFHVSNAAVIAQHSTSSDQIKMALEMSYYY